MIIHKPKIIEDETSVTISAKIEVENPLSGFPEFLFYKFPKGYKDFITDRVDGFAVSLLPLAMQLGEDLEIRGSLSSRLVNTMS
ncbi:MAG: hypothetical protein JRC99_13555 [Deltaproteobacteria bacterium]|nr:hypothetical protein [Deltaproteobacteria bacterium]